MRIKTVHLENIRSHTKTTVSFARGFNCLVGGLGCGKSTILYALDFAFVGDPLGRSYDYLLREETDIGKVAVEFVQGGKSYTVWRALRRREKGISQDAEQLKLYEEDKLIASVKGEAVAEQLKAITGLDKDLFREIVWVRQEHLKELLDAAPRERQKRLDELFGLSDYEAAWSGLAGIRREYEGERGAYERDFDVIGIEKLGAEYNKAVEDFSSIGIELGELGKGLAQVESALREATSRLQSLEELRRQTEKLQRKEAELQANIVNSEDLCARLADEIERRDASLSRLSERLKSMELEEKHHRDKLQEAGLKSDRAVEELGKHLAALENQAVSLRGEQEAIKNEILTFRRRISSLTAESKCPLCFQVLDENYKKQLFNRLQEEGTERQRRLAELQQNLDELERLHSTAHTAFLSLQSLAPQIRELGSRAAEEQESLKRLSKEFEEKQVQEKAFREQLGVIRKEIVKFDLSELESAKKVREEAFLKHSNIRHRLEIAESRKRDVASRLNELKERLDNAQQKAERMERIENLLGIVEGIRGAYRSIQPKFRGEFVAYLQRMVQHVLDDLVGAAGPLLTAKIDENYTPIIRSEEGYEREVANLSGGERTLLAFAYRLGLGQLIMQSRTGHGLCMLLLDEPTESIGREDGSVDRLAEAVSRLKAIEQIIAVTHSEAFAERAEHVIRVQKEAGVSRVSPER